MMSFYQYGDLGFLQDRLGALLGVLFLLAIVDTALKGWAMWRAARMHKLPWFIVLLIFNTLGILPAIFLLMTRGEYEKFTGKRV